MRGLAAFTVVLRHFSLMWPKWKACFGPWSIGPVHIAPLDLLFAGHEAVILFFVLSGLVLSLPYLRGRGQPYPTYLLRRVLRIYAPYVAALALALCGAAIWHGPHGQGGWADGSWSAPVNLKLVLQHLAFLGVYNWQEYDFVIWSLVYEMRISIVFPALALLIFRLRPIPAILLAGSLSLLSLVTLLNYPLEDISINKLMTFHFAAFFILGLLLAMHLSSLSTWYQSLSRLARVALFFGSFFMYNESNRIYDHFNGLSVRIAEEWVVAVGAVGFIIVAINSPIARRLLHSAVPTFLGRISYSLYLIHAPVLLALTFAIHKRLSAWAQFPLYLVATIGAAYLFCIAVEEPFTRMGQRLGRRSATA